MKLFSTPKTDMGKRASMAWGAVEKELTDSHRSLAAAAVYVGVGLATGVAAFLCPDAAVNTLGALKGIVLTMLVAAPVEFAVSQWKMGKVKKKLEKVWAQKDELDAMKGIAALRKKCFVRTAWDAVEDHLFSQRIGIAATGFMAGFTVGSVAAQLLGVGLSPLWDKGMAAKEAVSSLTDTLCGPVGRFAACSAVVGGLLYREVGAWGKTVKENLQKVAMKQAAVVEPVVERSRPVFSGIRAAQVLAG